MVSPLELIPDPLLAVCVTLVAVPVAVALAVVGVVGVVVGALVLAWLSVLVVAMALGACILVAEALAGWWTGEPS